MIRADTAGAVGAFVQGLVARHIKFAVFARVNERLGVAAPAPPYNRRYACTWSRSVMLLR